MRPSWELGAALAQLGLGAGRCGHRRKARLPVGVEKAAEFAASRVTRIAGIRTLEEDFDARYRRTLPARQRAVEEL